MITPEQRVKTVHDGKRCVVKRYLYGPYGRQFSSEEYGNIVCGVVGKRSGLFVGYVVRFYAGTSFETESYESDTDVIVG